MDEFNYNRVKEAYNNMLERFGIQVTIRNSDDSVRFTTYAVRKKYMKNVLSDSLIETSPEDSYLVQDTGIEVLTTYFVEFDANNIRTINSVNKIQPGSMLIGYQIGVEL